VVILPGMGGSAMQAKISKDDAPHFWCWQNWDEWFRVWLPLVELLAQDCWFDNLKVLYNASTDEYLNVHGVTTDVIDFGDLDGIDYMDYWFGFPISFTSYYSSLIASLEEIGYEGGKTMYGAPFDWRVPTTKHELDEEGFNARVKQLIERAYYRENKRVNVITHSLGGPTALAFLNTMDQAWLDKYISTFIPIAGPWNGSPKALRTTISGDNFGIEILGINLLNIDAVAQLAKQAGGLVELVPSSDLTKEVIVQNGDKTYTAKDIEQLYLDIGSPITAEIYKQTQDIFEYLNPPRVKSFCLYGYGFPTETFFNYTDGWDEQPDIVYSEDGDGTVPSSSLSECNRWDQHQPEPVTIKEFNLDHQEILEDDELFEYIIQIVTSNQ